MVEASQTDLLQIIMNLVVNGIDAHEGMPGEVRVLAKRPGLAPADGGYILGTPNPDWDYAAIVVEDTGKGMSEDVRKSVMEPYFTTKGNAGTGLGLAIVASIIADNEALLELDTEPGRGTKFVVWWPASSTDAGTSPRRVQTAKPKRNAPILVVDDVPEVAAAIASYLSGEGYEVAETNTPEIAAETIEEDPDAWACLITDYDMPEMTGGDLIARLRQTAPDLPLIVVSALARRLTDRRLADATAVLQKPVDRDKLLAVVRLATATDQETGDD